MTEYLDPKQAVEEIDRLAKPRRKTVHRDEGAWTVEPTPTSLRREREQASRRGWARRDTARGQDGGSSSLLRPAPARRPLTPEELRNVQELSRGKLVRPAQGHHRRAEDEDRRGEPCACGSTAGEACALHGRLYRGSRRRVRPGS